jgi:signal transduction histidine kinase
VTYDGDSAGHGVRSVVARPADGHRRYVGPVCVGAFGILVAAVAIRASLGAIPFPWWIAAPIQSVGVGFVAAGLFVWIRQPGGRRLGVLMAGNGIIWYAGDLQFSSNPLLFRLGFWLFFLNVVMLTHLLLAYPDGQLGKRAERITVATLYVWTLTAQGLRVLTEEPLEPQVWGRPQVARSVWAPAGSVVGLALTGLVLVLVVNRWRAEPAPARRERSLYWAAVVLIGIVIVAGLTCGLAQAPLPVQGLVLLAYAAAQSLLGAAVLVGALHAHMAHHRVTRFLTRTGPGSRQDGSLQAAIAEALDDRTLTLHYQRDGSSDYVDAQGRPFPLPSGGIAITSVTTPTGQPIAALAHDPFLTDRLQHRRRLEAVVKAAGLELENNRLAAENRAHLKGLRDIEILTRHRIRAALHDGVQSRLSALQLRVGELRGRLDDGDMELIADELQAAVQDLREVTEGIYPSILRANGLEDALDSLAQRSSIPLILDISRGRWPEHVEEIAFFVASEAVGNVHKHGRATVITVRVRERSGRLVVDVSDDGIGGIKPEDFGSGLRGLRDRLASEGGWLTIDSPLDDGTTVRAEIPCE